MARDKERDRQRAIVYRAENPEKVKEALARYKDNHRDRIKTNQNARRAANRDEDRARRRAYYHANPERVALHRQRTKAKHKERDRELARKRRAENKEAVNARQRERRAANKEKLNADRRANWEKNKEREMARAKAWTKANPEKVRSGQIAYRIANEEKLKAARKAWQTANAEKVKEGHKSWRAKNWPKVLSYNRIRKSRLRDAGGSHTGEDIIAIWKRQGRKCAVPNCTHPISAKPGKNHYHVDHVKAVVNGGSNDPSNLQILCSFHNIQKHDQDEYEWAQSIGRLFVA